MPHPPQLSASFCVSMQAPLPQHEFPSRVLQQVVPQETSPAKVEQHWPAPLHVPPEHCLSL